MPNKNRTLDFILISDDNGGIREDPWSGERYIEVLDPVGANTDRLKTFFKDHNHNTDSAIGRVDNVRLFNNELHGQVTFGSDSDSILNKYREGILDSCSIGYIIRDYKVEERDNEPDIVTVTGFDVIELSSVGIPFDRGAVHIPKRSDEDLIKEINIRLDNIAEKLGA